MQFCKRMERIFGRQCITPNMHMHGHLRSCMLDYGPLHGFWLYAFERYNGILGNIPHNNHSIEVQIMSKFLRDNEAFNMELPSENTSDFRDIFSDNNTLTPAGSLGDTTGGFHGSPSQAEGWPIDSLGLVVVLPSHYSRSGFDERQVELLTELYSKLYKVQQITVSSTFEKYSSATINGVVVTGYSRAQKYNRRSHFCRVMWDFSKKLPFLMLFRVLQLAHHQLTPSLTSRLGLSCIATVQRLQFYCTASR